MKSLQSAGFDNWYKKNKLNEQYREDEEDTHRFPNIVKYLENSNEVGEGKEYLIGDNLEYTKRFISEITDIIRGDTEDFDDGDDYSLDNQFKGSTPDDFNF
jgi:hypothetical protein